VKKSQWLNEEPDLETLVILFLRRNPGESLTTYDAAVKFNRSENRSRWVLAQMAKKGSLEKGPGRLAEYTLALKKKKA